MAVEMIRDFTGRGETGSGRIQKSPLADRPAGIGSGPEKPDFSDLVKDFAHDVNNMQFKAGAAVDDLVTGKAADVHQVMVAVETDLDIGRQFTTQQTNLFFHFFWQHITR